MQLGSPNATSGNHCAFNLTIVAFSLSGDRKQFQAQCRHDATFRHAAQVGGFQSKEFELPSGRLTRRHFLSLPPSPFRRLRRTGRFSSFARCGATEDKPCAAGVARDSQIQRKENPMNTDKLSTGGASPSADRKKREGETRKSPCTP